MALDNMPAGDQHAQQRRVLIFVCTGNVCRSPMAEYLMIERFGKNTCWSVASAGISAVPGMPASAPAVTVMAELGIDIRRHRSQMLTRGLIEAATLVVVMTGFHKLAIDSQFPGNGMKVRLLKSFSPNGGGGDVPDPIGLSEEVYRRTRQEIDDALLDLIIFLKKTPPGGLCAEGSRP